MGSQLSKPVLVPGEQSFHTSIEGRKQEKTYSREHNITCITPETRIAEQQRQLDSPVDLGRRRKHDQEDCPERLIALQ